MNRDIQAHVKLAVSIEWGNKTADADGAAVDTKGYESVAVVLRTGTDTAGTHSFKVQQRDNTTDAWADVAASDLYGDTNPADLAADTVYKFGIKNPLRYVKGYLTTTNEGLECEAHFILGHPQER